MSIEYDRRQEQRPHPPPDSSSAMDAPLSSSRHHHDRNGGNDSRRRRRHDGHGRNRSEGRRSRSRSRHESRSRHGRDGSRGRGHGGDRGGDNKGNGRDNDRDNRDNRGGGEGSRGGDNRRNNRGYNNNNNNNDNNHHHRNINGNGNHDSRERSRSRSRDRQSRDDNFRNGPNGNSNMNGYGGGNNRGGDRGGNHHGDFRGPPGGQHPHLPHPHPHPPPHLFNNHHHPPTQSSSSNHPSHLPIQHQYRINPNALPDEKLNQLSVQPKNNNNSTNNNNEDPRGNDPTKRITSKAKHKGSGMNTESFDPASTLVRPDLRVWVGSKEDKVWKKSLKHDDVVIIPELFGPESNWDLYYKLVEEMRTLQNSQQPNSEWISWHEGAHLISKNPQGSPTFELVIDRLCEFFRIQKKSIGTRFNWYRDSSDWKPFHHDSAAYNERRAKTQNITVGVSFGACRELAFLRATPLENGDKVKIYFPQTNNGVFSFGRDVNILWKHGINALAEEDQDGKGRISIILWGLADGLVEEKGSPPLLGSDGVGPHAQRQRDGRRGGDNRNRGQDNGRRGGGNHRGRDNRRGGNDRRGGDDNRREGGDRRGGDGNRREGSDGRQGDDTR